MWGSSATGWSSSVSGSWPQVSVAETSAMALWACLAVAEASASSASTRPARANDIYVPSSARSRLSRSVRRLPDSPRITCLLYTSDAADEEDSVDLGGRRIIKKKNKTEG